MDYLDMEEYDLVGAAAIDDETAVIVSETDAAESHSHSSSSSDEADLGEEECNERSSSWLSSSVTQQQRQHPHDDDSSDDNSDDNANVNGLMKDESAAVGSYQDDLHCDYMDDEDEAWVYQHMRGGGGREELMNAQHLQRYSQRQSRCETSTAKNEQHHRAKKLRGHEDESSAGRDTDGDGEAALESETNENCQHQQKHHDQHHHDQHHHDQHQQEASMSNPSKQQQQRQQPASPSSTMSLVKPRSSDAILSCPSCFNIVCMDCQQHEKYANQYRAMFVMNIGVDWSRKMIYDDAMGCLKLLNGGSDGANGSAIATGGEISGDQMGEENLEESNDDDDVNMQLRGAVNLGEGRGANSRRPDKIPEEHHETSSMHNVTQEEKSEEYDSYYSVHCSYCRHEVAALDMKDEIYYFFGCIASA